MCMDLLANVSAPHAGADPSVCPYPAGSPECPVLSGESHLAGSPLSHERSDGSSVLVYTGRSHIPGPRTPLVGWQVRLVPILRDPVVSMLNLQRRYGNIVTFGQSPAAPVLVFGPEYNH